MILQQELIIERNFDFDQNEIDNKQVPRIKKLRILQIFYPFILLLLCALLFAMSYWLLGDKLVSAIIYSSIPLITNLVCSIGLFFIIRKSKNQVRDSSVLFPTKQKWILNNEGININAEISDSILSWKYITKIEETDYLIMFYLTRKHSFFIPKNILNEKQLDKLFGILEANLGSSILEVIGDKKTTDKTE